MPTRSCDRAGIFTTDQADPLPYDGRQSTPHGTTVADIILYCALDFGGSVKQPLDPSLKNVNAWFKRVDSRPSAKSSLHPASAQMGMKG